jgi:hypothetical protein
MEDTRLGPSVVLVSRIALVLQGMATSYEGPRRVRKDIPGA